MTNPVSRRYFLGAAGLAAASTALAQNSPNNKLIVGVMGTGGRGTALCRGFANAANVEVKYTCDVDRDRAAEASKIVEGLTKKAPEVIQDYRRILQDKEVDILVCATCNHWHAPATIAALAAGKHVYVEKPCSHTPREGELMVQAARKADKKVQMGNQRRSYAKIIEAIEEVRKGTIGRAYYAQCWYLNLRPTIGRGMAVAAPANLDYNLWQGPAPRKEFRSNFLHYNWHWFWHWGNGELGNNGVHYIDLCRWGLDVEYPTRVTSTGGRYRFEDDQETPDTNLVNYDFAGGKSIKWEGLSCNRMPAGKGVEIQFHGERGTIAIEGNGYSVYDPAGKLLRAEKGEGGDSIHINNFLEGVRGNGRLSSEIEIAHKSTLLCHLGNIAYRTGRLLNIDNKTGQIRDDKQAMQYWTREYEKGYEPTV